ncbi:serine/threonine-protein kinase-like protein At5g23170 [Tasmannia lanceolata]|uniref:serine/threonine-protein kinase-like protein At5g23170 n=1 Tax=Tasmannia lanceolata TaxID=3420 RepID=UPI004064A1ED
MEKFSYIEIEVATKGFALERLIGKGSHGCVYKGVLQDGKLVAVKKASLALQLVHDNSKLDNEIEILSTLQSPHTVNLLGVSQDSGPKLLVMEFMPNGSLDEFLHNSSNPPTWFRRTLLALQLAQAIQTLHEASPPVIHRDIKSANILFDSDWNARLADFSLAVRRHYSEYSADNYSEVDGLTLPAGTIGYLDPCYTRPGKLSTKNDVFSFGIVLLEAISGRRALDVGFVPASIVEWALPLINSDRTVEICDSRVPLPKNMKNMITRLLSTAAQCVSSNEERRPTMGEIVTELESVVESCRRSSIWSFLRSIFLRKKYPSFRAKRKNTRRILCRNDLRETQGG